MKTTVIGAQLYIFSKMPDFDAQLEHILQGLALAGYGAIEGNPAHSRNYKAELNACKLQYAASHMVLRELSDIDKVIAYQKAMGGLDICSSGLLDWHQRSAADYRNSIAVLNAAGLALRKHGIHLHYHNHEFEFEKVAGAATGMDLLLNGLDHHAVDLCLDTGWVWRGGVEPGEFVRKHRDKIGYVHLRDFKGSQSVELGRGEMTHAPIMAAVAEIPNLRWLVVEQDPDAAEPLKSMTISRQYLRDSFAL